MNRLSKLRAMSSAEIAFRLRERGAGAIERFAFARGWLARPDRLRRALRGDIGRQGDWEVRLLAVRAESRALYFSGVSERATMRALFESRFEEEASLARRQAELAREHRFTFFGHTFDAGREIDWHADPVSHSRWPVRYHGDIPIHKGDVGFGDVKFVWELGRQQFLVDLAKSHYLFDHPTDAAETRALVNDWMVDNPYGCGVHWACALEPAFRAQSWLWSYFLTLDAVERDPRGHLQWLAGFADHGHFLHRHLERYSSPFNHLTGEAATLYALGVLFPEFAEAAAWRRRGRGILESGLAGQFHGDGGTVEQSTFYHHATLGFYMLAALLGRRNGEEFNDQIWEAIERGIEFSMILAQPDGRMPAIGGADDGKPIRLEHLPFWDFRAYQAVGAVLFGRSDFKYAAGRFYEDALWLLGPSGLSSFDAMAASPPREASRALKESGYFVLRSDWAPTADYVSFDCGEQAAGVRKDDIPSAVHGHADCLSVSVSLGGRAVLVDPGFFCYNGDPEWEAHFRRTGAHNTARIDGRDQARLLSKMDWCRTFTPRLEQWYADGGQAWVTGSHDGFAREGIGVTHRRTVVLRPGGYVVLFDQFEGDGRHAIELTYQFAPGEARLSDQRVMYESVFEVGWLAGPAGSHSEALASPALLPRLSCGGPGPHEGWIAASLGVRVPAPRVDLPLEFAGRTCAVVTVLADCRKFGGRPRVERVRIGELDALTVQAGQGCVDWIAVPDARSTLGSLDTDARLAIWRVARETVSEEVAVGGTYLRVADTLASEARGLVKG